jgi:DNA repair protein RecN (Recombination protein N)
MAVIDELELELAPGLNVLTGETGAGKSVIVRALALLCGGRASADLIRTDSDEASVEALFEDVAPEWLDRHGLPGASEVVVRRVFSRSGRSRAWVNGSAVSSTQLAALGASLVHIYGQHEQTALLRPETHLDLLDEFAGLQARRAEMEQAYSAWQAAYRRWRQALDSAGTVQGRMELLHFQVAELQQARLVPGEHTQLQAEREKLRHVEKLQRLCGESEAALESAETNVVDLATRITHALGEAARIDPELTATVDLVHQARTLMSEAAFQLRRYLDRLEFDPERFAAVEDRLALLSRLARKYGCEADDLPDRLEELERELEALQETTPDPQALREELHRSFAQVREIAHALSQARQRAAQDLAARVRQELRALGMREAALQVEFRRKGTEELARGAGHKLAEQESGVFDYTGADAVEFLWCANPGEAARPLARIASGGELSRVMLALKVLTGAARSAALWLFDEVDAGIGGATATAVGKRLHALARQQQILCITHLPQIAAFADCHLAVEKNVRNGRTYTRARAVAGQERVRELARMLGSTGTESERYARELLAALKPS